MALAAEVDPPAVAPLVRLGALRRDPVVLVALLADAGDRDGPLLVLGGVDDVGERVLAAVVQNTF